MKRITAILLAFLMCLSTAACASTLDPTHQYILYLLEQGEYDMAIHVIEGLRDGKQNNPPSSVDAQPQSTASDVEQLQELTPTNNGSDWFFHMDVINQSSSTLALQAVIIRDFWQDEELRSSGFEGADLEGLTLGGLMLEPHSGRGWDDACPMGVDFNRREYLFIFHDEQGAPYRMSFLFDMQGAEAQSAGEPGNAAPQPQNAPAAFQQEENLMPINTGTDWLFQMDVVNRSSFSITLQALLIRDYQDEQEQATYGFEGADLDRLDLGGLVLTPGSSHRWNDAYPSDADFNRREYLFVFHDEQGQPYRISLMFDMRGVSPDPSWQPEGADPAQLEERWVFPVTLFNSGDTQWKLQMLEVINFMDGQATDTYLFEDSDLERLFPGGLLLEPGQQTFWSDGHPVTSAWNSREYRFRFVDANGQEQVVSCFFDELDKQNQPMDFTNDTGKDTKTLRYDAAFEVEVADGVYWVPAVSLGQSRYSNMDIHNMLDASPQEKQQHIATLYEALQLYQVGNFTPSDDNVRIFENGVNWEHHKPGYHAVRTNTGCCATDSNWLRYILDGDYQETGYIATSQRDGSGHIFNYILHEGWYYIIDLTHYHANGDSMMTAVENGDLSSYYATDFVLGNIHKVQDITNFVNYVQAKFNEPPGLMFMYTAENCLAVDGARSQSSVEIIYEETGKSFVNVIFDDPSDGLTLKWMESPQNLPDWEQLP